MAADTSSTEEEIHVNGDAPDQLITEAMTKQEEAMQKAAAKKQSKPDKNVKEIDQQEETARVARLKFLIEKSKIYTSILSEKLLKQQEASRKKGEEQDGENEQVQARKSKAGNYDLAKYVDADDLKQKSNGDSTSSALSKATKNSSKTRKQTLIEDKEENESGNGVTATAKPSASARQPELVTGGVLRDYQLAGLEWMVSLYENGLNGILADEMGLGKTLQTIAFLAFLRSKGVHGPFLIAAPLSTVANWVNEVRRFAPDIPVVLYHGTKDERADIRKTKMGQVDAKFPIVVTSYEIIMNDRKFLQKYSWKYIVVDEGHRLKNLNCRLIRELKSYTSANRLLLTGTPLQNNLSELWSLLNFLLPDIFSDLESFQSWFDFSSLNSSQNGNLADEEQQGSVVAQLHQILKPFLLRRLKTDVEKDLPKKREYLLYAPMTAHQTDLYKAILGKRVNAFYRKERETNGKSLKRKADVIDLEEIDTTSAKRSRSVSSYKEPSEKKFLAAMEAQGDFPELPVKERSVKAEQPHTNQLKLSNMLMSLRKACNHPYQMDWPVHDGSDEYVVDKNIVNTSGKMLLLNRLLSALFKAGHKVLIFSQFTSMLDILEVWAEDVMGLNVSRIDGNVAQEIRREQIADFNSDPDHKLFLLSTRAGGLGINLTSADTVILFDSDWNPQVDLQAMDRVHRIGQKKPVIVYRFVSANTIESKILEKAGNKRKLEKVVIQKDKFKSIIAGANPTNQDVLATLNEILMQEDAESIQVKSESDEIISDADLAKIMDRSDSAYEHTDLGAENSIFKSITTARDQENDELATK
ncbi:putative SNF2 family helicase/ATPase PasG [Taphrina deformans PYCC 5710]|uniref:SNF2 family helicase/ATPase PasG n=1 Tax=Taphrina deformans (strain PYCC 5710 / ATCC 11124 / CBS 356.35 / IMI 108563 / JCM 9778 / NBRC 8474) TaxID=1097556 RepID=R4X6Z0_TAPDE|nr:putative SNF2 family helicase/ATPase PasG [Taphrina deformans PYCC 5710]|eukprot:CCG80996.1 putative SNF2 family helicase/ATPase PasG [Taphrina deformans PYCC 5710]